MSTPRVAEQAASSVALMGTAKKGEPPDVQVYMEGAPESSTPASQAPRATEMSPRVMEARVLGRAGLMLRHCAFTLSHWCMEVRLVAESREKIRVAPPVGEEVA